MQHDWIPSTLGHGETMCRRCFITNREAAVLGKTNECDAPAPAASNDNKPKVQQWTQEQIDAEVETYSDGDDGDPYGELDAECGLADDGQCSMAGSEHCDFTCAYRDSEYFAGSKAWRQKHRKKKKSVVSVSNYRGS